MTEHQSKLLINILTETVSAFYRDQLVSLAIFGSFARGTASPVSDIDVLIVAENLPSGRLKRVDDFSHIEDVILTNLEKPGVGMNMSPVIKSPQELVIGNSILWDMTEHVIICYDKDDFLKNLLSRVKDRMKSLGSYKVFCGNDWYWVLKGEYACGEVFEF